MVYLKLALFGLISPLLVLAFFYLKKWKKFHDLNFYVKQVIYGLVFGGVAVLCTEFGVRNGGVILNVRDSAVIAAGLLFGWPAGVLSGLIGGLERFFSTYWTGASYTQVACSISTFISGALAGVIRRFVFRDKTPKWFQAFGVGIVLETSHILMIFVTNMGNVIYAFSYVTQIGNTMIVGVGLSCMVSALILNILEYDWKNHKIKTSKKWSISGILHSLLFVTSLFAYLNVALFTYNIQNRISNQNATNILSNGVSDVAMDIDDNSDAILLERCRSSAYLLESFYDSSMGYFFDDAYLKALVNPGDPLYMKVAEINYIDENGIIIYTSTPEWKGYDMRSGEQSNEFVTRLLIDKEDEFVQAFRTTSGDAEIAMKYAGKRMQHGGFIQVGFSNSLYYAELKTIVQTSVRNRHIGQNGIMVITDTNFDIVATTALTDEYTRLEELGFYDNLSNKSEYKMYTSTSLIYADNGKIRYLFATEEGYYIIGIVSEAEVMVLRNMSIYVNSYLELIVFSLVFMIIYVIFNRFVLRDLKKVNEGLAKITSGDLSTTLKVDTSREFEYLSGSINNTVDALKGFIEKESKRMEEELAMAKAIQLSSLPSQLAYLYQHEFGVYASMIPARNVGGDFYDYFQLTDGKFAVVIADVSGKGVPAALFMMRAKSLIKSYLEIGLSISEAIDRANKKLCEGNEAEMFVTCWAATISQNGLMEFVNAGHNPPLIRHHGRYEYLRTKVNFVLGAMDKAKYEKQTMQLDPGDVVFLYTDGITEARNVGGDFYGERRLLDCINKINTLAPQKISETVLEEVMGFAGEHEQSDDITLLTFTYLGPDHHERFKYEGKMENYEQARIDLLSVLEKAGLNKQNQDKFVLCLEEIYTNIANYGYGASGKEGQIIMDVSYSNSQVSLTFTDTGIKFNPLKKDDPDISLTAADRPIGGLGIFMVKKIMDSIYYTYQDGRNILTMSMYLMDKKGE